MNIFELLLRILTCNLMKQNDEGCNNIFVYEEKEGVVETDDQINTRDLFDMME